jgi:ABC-type amino acid transport substrate-binding protein
MNNRRTASWIVFALALLPALPGDADAADPEVLRVGIKEAPPFAIRSESGAWSGIAVDLWTRIATEQDLRYEYEERDLKGMLRGVQDGELDLAVGAITVTPEREQRFDFSHPFFVTGLGIAVHGQAHGGVLAGITGLFSLQFVKAVGVLVLLLLAIGVLVWLAERRANSAQFGGPPSHGIGSGFWWSAVTMTTVGYGDKAPVTPLGRLIGLVWMFASILLLSVVTGAIAASLTTTQLRGAVAGPDDLPRVRVGSVTNTTSAEYLEQQGIRFQAYEGLGSAMTALAQGDLDAVVYDAPLLRYHTIAGPDTGLTVLPSVFRRQDYAFAVAEDSPLRELLNIELLSIVKSAEWEGIRKRYLGADG